jgi:hypothetical protein
LFLLDHYASDASWSVFRLALRDPVPSVREVALHGLSCERCRTEDLCVADVVTDLIDILTSDPNAEVRHKAVAALARFLDRDGVPSRPSPVRPVTITKVQSGLSPELLLIAVSLTFVVGNLHCAKRSAGAGQVTEGHFSSA